MLPGQVSQVLLSWEVVAVPLEDALGPVKEVLYNAFVVNAAFRSGFCWGISLTALIGLASRYLLYFLKPIRDFFKPSSKPATNQGPSPFQQMVGCLKVVMLAFGLILLFGVYIFFSSVAP
jgi:hypothetical protein